MKCKPSNGVSFGAKHVITSADTDASAVAEVVTLVTTSGVTVADNNCVVTLPSLAPVNVPVLFSDKAEQITFTLATGCTTSGDLGITLSDDLGEINIPLLDAPTNEVITFTVATGCTTSGNLGIKLSDELGYVNVAMDQAIQTTAELVADAVRASVAFTGWTLSGVGENVIFTKDVAGINVGSAGVNVGSTGITLTEAGIVNSVIGEVADSTPALVGDKIRSRGSWFTGWTLSGVDENVIFTKDTTGVNVGTAAVDVGTTGVTLTVAGITKPVVGAIADSTPTLVANKLRLATYPGWTTGGSGATVTFTKDVAGAVAGSPTFVGTLPGVTATIDITTPGADATDPNVEFDFRVNSNSPFRYPLVAVVNILRAGVVTNPVDLKITYPYNGVVRVDGTLVEDDVINLVAQCDRSNYY